VYVGQSNHNAMPQTRVEELTTLLLGALDDQGNVSVCGPSFI